jgi:DNA (cytosine-5)-methyltransferase 1
MTGRVVDLYAGPGGWDEGLRSIGITDVIGIEIEANACATARAAGHDRVQADVSAVRIGDHAGAWGLVASPPCQAWSMAGKRQGEVDRAKVHALIDAYAAGSDNPGDDWADPRSHHAAQPVRWVRELRPAWVCFEQVPLVLGLWQHASDVLRRWGYSTWMGVLNAADYGVPQTRERAILIARLDGPAAPPAPTHTRRPEGVDLFGAELLPWVTMADALGWGLPDRPAWTVTAGGAEKGGVEVFGNAGSRKRLREVVEAAWAFERPATTVCGDPRIGRPGHKDRSGGEAQFANDSIRVSIQDAAVLQSFPAGYPWQGTVAQQHTQAGNAVPPRLAAAVAGSAIRVSASAGAVAV